MGLLALVWLLLAASASSASAELLGQSTSPAPVPPPLYSQSSPPPLPPSYPPSKSPPPVPSSSLPPPLPTLSPSPVAQQPTFTFPGLASFIGPAKSCQGFALDGYGTYNLTTATDGSFTGGSSPSAVEVFVVVTSSGSSCTDAFTTLPLPFSVAGALYRPTSSAGSMSAIATPATRLLQYTMATTDNVVGLTYGYFGINATSAPAGAFAAIRSNSTAG
ncbi:hypothetical protein Agub_g11550, partial [Astrephomene gubernaculifera]